MKKKTDWRPYYLFKYTAEKRVCYLYYRNIRTKEVKKIGKIEVQKDVKN